MNSCRELVDKSMPFRCYQDVPGIPLFWYASQANLIFADAAESWKAHEPDFEEADHVDHQQATAEEHDESSKAQDHARHTQTPFLDSGKTDKSPPRRPASSGQPPPKSSPKPKSKKHEYIRQVPAFIWQNLIATNLLFWAEEFLTKPK